MARTYIKHFTAHPPAWRRLSFEARALLALLHDHPVEIDGTVVMFEPGEAPEPSLMQALEVPPRKRRHWHKYAAELFDQGFLFIDGDRARLPNWADRQGWRKGPIPSPIHEPVGGTSSDRRATVERPSSDRRATVKRQSSEPNHLESFDPDSANGTSTGSLILATKGGTPCSVPLEEETEGECSPPIPKSVRSAAPQGSAEWCAEELDPFDAELFEEVASR